MRPVRKASAGFTLTEVLVATVLLSIIMTAVYSLFSTVLAIGRAQEYGMDHRRSVAAFVDLLRRDCNNIPAAGAAWFEGAEDSLTLYTVARPMDVTLGEEARLFRVRCRLNTSTGAVIREEAVVEEGLPADSEGERANEVDVEDANELVVLEGVKGFTFRYVWLPRPEAAYWQSPPKEVAPRLVSQHRRGWGLPQAIEVAATTVVHGSEPSAPWAHRLVTRAPGRQREGWELDRMLEGVE